LQPAFPMRRADRAERFGEFIRAEVDAPKAMIARAVGKAGNEAAFITIGTSNSCERHAQTFSIRPSAPSPGHRCSVLDQPLPQDTHTRGDT
jgi:hypothetical protein